MESHQGRTMAKISLQQGTLSLSGCVLINTISDALTHLQDLQLTSPLVMDFSQVHDADTVAISLILEVQRTLHQHDKTAVVTVTGVSDNLRSLMQLYGVDGFLLN